VEGLGYSTDPDGAINLIELNKILIAYKFRATPSALPYFRTRMKQMKRIYTDVLF
jgi:hypothetical protein